MKDMYHYILKKLAHYQTTHPYWVLLLILMLTVAIYGGVSKVRTVASLEQMMPKDIEEIKAFNQLRDNHLGQDMIAVIIEVDSDSTDPNGVIDVRDRRVFDYIEYAKQLLYSEPDVLEVYAYSDIVDSQGLGDGLSDSDYDLAINNPAISSQLRNYVNSDSTITIMILTTDVSADDPRMNLLSDNIKSHFETLGHPSGVKIELTGTPIIQQRLGELLAKDRKDTQWISTLLVFLITMITFGTFTSALVPIIVVTLSVNWLYGTMGYNNLPISTLAGGVAAMVIGIGIDFAIHIMNKFKFERKNGLSIKDAIEQAVVDTGTALTATSLTTIVAFLAYLSGAMPEMGRFGILMAIGIVYSLLFSLVGLPALLVIEERLIYRYGKKAHFGIEGEFSLKKSKKVKGCDNAS